jgi:hypothetical protein
MSPAQKKAIEPSMTGRLPILRYSGTRMSEPKPYTRLAYDISPDAVVGEMPNSADLQQVSAITHKLKGDVTHQI